MIKTFNLFTAIALAGLWLPAAADEPEIRRNLAERIPQFQKIDEVSRTAMPGLFEVRVNGTEVFYTDAEANFKVTLTWKREI